MRFSLKAWTYLKNPGLGLGPRFPWNNPFRFRPKKKSKFRVGKNTDLWKIIGWMSSNHLFEIKAAKEKKICKNTYFTKTSMELDLKLELSAKSRPFLNRNEKKTKTPPEPSLRCLSPSNFHNQSATSSTVHSCGKRLPLFEEISVEVSQSPSLWVSSNFSNFSAFPTPQVGCFKWSKCYPNI